MCVYAQGLKTTQGAKVLAMTDPCLLPSACHDGIDTPALSRSQQTRIIDQAIIMLEGFYAHLPLKRAMYALDPLQRLRLLRQRLHTFNSAASFHREMTSIFTSLHDLHTNYCLPAPFKDANAWLPFKVESYCGIHPGGIRPALPSIVSIW